MGSRYNRKMVWSEPVVKEWIFQRDKYICHICGLCCTKWEQREQGEPVDPSAATLDHIVPIDLGGAHAIWNVATSCFACNTEKANNAFDVDLRMLLKVNAHTTRHYNKRRKSLEKGDRLTQNHIERSREGVGRTRMYTINPTEYDMPSVFIPDPYKPVNGENPYGKLPKVKKSTNKKSRNPVFCIVEVKGACKSGCLSSIFCHGYSR